MTKIDTKVVADEYEVNDRGDGLFVLQYPAGVLGDKGAAIKVSKEVFDYALKSPTPLRELIELFELNNNRVLYQTGPTQQHVDTRDHSDKTKHHGKGFFVSIENGEYYLSYQLARHGGGTGRFAISEEIYEYAKTEGLSTKDLFEKFNLYHLDV